MPDREIASLTAGSAPDGTEIFHGVQGGNSRKFTGAQLSALAADPATDDGDTLGTASKRWSDLFLASGGVVNWANGDVTVTHAANTLTFAGASSGYSLDAALLLPSGGIISFNSGDVTITHSANALAFAGASSGYSFDVAPNVGGSTVALLGTADQVVTGGARVTTLDDGTKSSGTYTPDPGDRPMIRIVNGGAFTLAPGTNVGAYLLDITNNASAGAITTSGWTKVVGSFTTTNGHKFRCHCSIGDVGSLLAIQAMQ